MSSFHLRQLQRILNQSAELDNESLRTEIQRLVLASGERAITIGGDASHCIFITGDNVQLTFETVDADVIRNIFREEAARITADACRSSLQDYLRALRHFCAQPSYLTLKLPNQNTTKPPEPLYVPLRARHFDQHQEVMLEDVLRLRAERTSDLPSLLPQTQRGGNTPRHLLLMCRSGAGKSTSLRRFAAAAWDDWERIGLERPYIPLLVKLQALAAAVATALGRS